MKIPRKISEVDLTLPLAGTEGFDINYIGRIRTQYLFAQHQALVAQTQFADAKAAALMTLVGLIAKAAEAPKLRKATRPTLASKKRRLEGKTRRAGIKAMRGRPARED